MAFVVESRAHQGALGEGGCSCGADRAQRLQAEYAAYKALGAEVLIIGQGGPAQAAHPDHRKTA